MMRRKVMKMVGMCERIVIVSWQNASQRSQVGVGMNRCATG